MQVYKVTMLCPVSAEVKAYTHQQAVDAAVFELQQRHANYKMMPLVLSTEELKGVDNDPAL